MGSYTYVNLQTRISSEIQDSSNTGVTLAQVKNAIISAIEFYERERTWFNETVSRSLVTVANAPVVAVPSDIVLIDKLQIATTSTFTADTSNGTATLLNSTTTLPSVGQFITGTGIPASTMVKSVTGSAPTATVTMMDQYGATANATATNTGITVRTMGQSKYTLDENPYDELAIKMATSTTSGQPSQYAYYQDRLFLFPTPGSIYALTLSYVQRLTTLSADGDNNGWTNYAEPLIRSRAKWDIFEHLLFFPELASACREEEVETLMALDVERYQRNATGRTRAVYL